MIKEVIVVEGRDDQAAISKAVEATTIATHGFGISEATFALIEKAYGLRGLIIFTDPDYAGEQIRKRLTKRFPGSKQAYLPKAEAMKGTDVGIENANPQSILEALSKAKCTLTESKMEFTPADMNFYGLAGGAGSGEIREKTGKKLGIGYGNGKEFLKRLNQYGITREELENAIDRS